MGVSRRDVLKLAGTALAVGVGGASVDVAKRREIVYDIQRHIAHHAYALYDASQKVVSVWEPYVKTWSPNNGFDYGGRLMAAWIDR